MFYTGCNVLKTPHIALLCLDIMDALGVSYHVMGGPTHCCGVIQLRAGDTETSSRFAGNTIGKLSQSKSGQVLAWCPSCFVQFTENMLPTFERATGAKPFDMTPFMLFLRGETRRLRPFLRKPRRRCASRCIGIRASPASSKRPRICCARCPASRSWTSTSPRVGLQSVNLATLPLQAELQLKELEAARAAGVDALVAVYHSDHRELCAHERDWPFRIINVLEIIGESMGFARRTTTSISR